MEKIRVKVYWVMNIRTLEEYILDAENLKEVIERTKIPKKLLKILKVYYRKKYQKSDLILSQ